MTTFMLKLIYQYFREVFKIKKFDLAIIGAGPIGLFSANYAQLHNLKSVLFDSLNDIGGQPQMLYPFKQIRDIPAYPSISAEKLIQNLKDGINQNTSIITNHSVKDISKKEDYFIIDEDYQVKTVIIATGNGAFNPKKLPLKIGPKVEDKINYFIKDPKQFNNKTIAILGGGDSALDWAAEFGKTNQIKLIHRREQFRGLEATLEEIKNLKNVEIITPYIPKGLELVDNHLKLNFKKVGDDENKEIACDEIIVAYGFKANNRFVKKWGIELNGTKIAVNSVMQTNLSGIYAVGDAVDYSGRVPIIGVGFGEVQIAITDIMRKLFPEKTLTIHSTSM